MGRKNRHYAWTPTYVFDDISQFMGQVQERNLMILMQYGVTKKWLSCQVIMEK